MAEAAPAESPSKKRPAWFGWVVGVGVVVVAAAAFFVTKSVAGGGSSSPAGATTNSSTPGNGSGQRGGLQGRFPGTAGEISAISGTTLTVQDRQGQSVKVTTTDSTRFTTEKTVAVSDIAKGDRVSVNGTQSGTTIAATRVTIADLQATPQGNGLPGGATPGNGPQNGSGPPGGFGAGPPPTDANGNPTGFGSGNGNGNGNGRPPGGFAFGTVTAVDGNTITLSSFDGSTVTVTTTPSTTVTKSVQGSLSDLKVGQNVRAMGTTGSDGTVAATSVSEGSGGFGLFGGGGRGQGTP